MSQEQINVIGAEQVGDYRIRLSFDDGVVQVVDFKPFLSRSRHPELRAYLDPIRFASFGIVYGELVWGDYDLCFPMMDLHENRLDKAVAFEAAA